MCQAPKETIDQALASRYFVADNTMAAERIAANLEILKRETGVTDAEIVRVPALYTREAETRAADGTEVPLPRLTRLGGSSPPARSRTTASRSGSPRTVTVPPPRRPGRRS
ncbi:hypothetical protein SGLAM104S_05893 [Streptomyces glaucescens]